MNLIKDNLNILLNEYKKYFNDKNIKVNNFLQYKNKVKSQLNKFNKNELINIKLEVKTYLIKLESTSWDNYVSIRIAVIATILSAISTINSLKKMDFYIKAFLWLSVLYMFTFTYFGNENVKKKMFYNILIECVDEILKDKYKDK